MRFPAPTSITLALAAGTLSAFSAAAGAAIVSSIPSAVTPSAPTSGNGQHQYRLDSTTGTVQFDTDGGNNSFVDTDKSGGDWILNGLNVWQSFNNEVLQYIPGYPSGGNLRANLLFVEDGGATISPQTVGIDVYLNDLTHGTDSNGPLYLWFEVFAWNAGETGPVLSANGPNASIYNPWLQGDAVKLLDVKVAQTGSGIAGAKEVPAEYTTVELGEIDVGDGYDFYAWRIGAAGYDGNDGTTGPDQFRLSNITAVPEPSSALCLALLGLATGLRRRR
ncbi:PEP-CTERM sorting domain-containing protein [Haloferula sp. A504]|uniref:PEP-CTERM sorting domain-containing protein n=1 Tax=Haloferula sp. A504 TaxID=3373601 RepID=UPI0031C7F0C0|nr:PEP-CTERM sorting domain-containing protein [Verrucomicrobiaceae bacterium E54]